MRRLTWVQKIGMDFHFAVDQRSRALIRTFFGERRHMQQLALTEGALAAGWVHVSRLGACLRTSSLVSGALVRIQQSSGLLRPPRPGTSW
jgi:hypothetical protein